MLVIGLTGGIATGKSTVTTLLKAHSIPVVDADILARQVVEPGTRAHSQIVHYFGEDILLADGTLNRPKLGSIIFNDTQKRNKLNSIVHPAVRRAMLWGVLKCWMKGERICCLDVPLLIEAGLSKWVGKIVVVTCSEEVQLLRLMDRDKSTRETALSRIRSQMPISQKARYADEIIDNSGALEGLEEQISELVKKYRNEVRWTWWVEWVFPPLGIASALFIIVVRGIKRNVCSQILSTNHAKKE